MKLWKLFFLTDLDFELAFPKSIFYTIVLSFIPSSVSLFPSVTSLLCLHYPPACFISPTMRCLQGNGEERARVFLRTGFARHCPPAGPDLSICPSGDHHEQVPQLPGRSACLPQTLRPKLPLRKARCKNIMKHPSRVWQVSLCLAFLLRSFWSQQFW